MLVSLREYIPAIFRAWWAVLVVGSVGGVFGLMMDAFPHDSIPQWWLWAGLLIITLVVAPFQAFHKMRVDRDTYAPGKARPDWPINEALCYLYRDSGWANFRTGLELQAIQEFHQAAEHGDVQLWGRPVRQAITAEDGALIDIRREQGDYWHHYLFEDTACLDKEGSNHAQKRANFNGMPEKLYKHIHTNKAQVLKRWARPKWWRRMKNLFSTKSNVSR